MQRVYRILNLGAGVQSTAVFLMMHEGTITAASHAVFADTQEEPKAVYEHLQWLKTIPQPAPTILTGTIGRLGDHLVNGINSTGGRFVSIPAFTAESHEKRKYLGGCNYGITRRQCTKEYKIDVIERTIRREILGVAPKRQIPKDVKTVQVFGISWDERRRADRIRERMAGNYWSLEPEFPLIDMHWTRDDCQDYLNGRVPHEVRRSACVFCPYKQASEWVKTKECKEDWDRAVEIDNAIRDWDSVCSRKMSQSLYVYRTCVPLEMVDWDREVEKEKCRKGGNLFAQLDCGEGMCGV